MGDDAEEGAAEEAGWGVLVEGWEREGWGGDEPADHAVGAFDGVGRAEEFGDEGGLGEGAGEDVGGIAVDEAAEAGEGDGLLGGNC